MAIQLSKEQIERRMKTCRHWRGIEQSKVCHAGIEYDTLRDDTQPLGVRRLPCMNPDIPCPKASYLTENEIRKEEHEMNQSCQRNYRRPRREEVWQWSNTLSLLQNWRGSILSQFLQWTRSCALLYAKLRCVDGVTRFD